VHVPPLPFLPASTVYSARPPQVCCTLHPIMGFGPFQAPPLGPPCGSTNDLNPPRDRASHPSELSPRPQPYRVTAAFALSSFERFTSEAPPIPRLFSVAESVAAADVAADYRPMLSWASFPSRVLPEFSVIDLSRDPKASLFLDADPPLSFDVYTTRRSTKVHQRNPVAFFLPAPGCWLTLSSPLARIVLAFLAPSTAQRPRMNPLTLALWFASSGADRTCSSRIADPHGVCDVKERP